MNLIQKVVAWYRFNRLKTINSILGVRLTESYDFLSAYNGLLEEYERLSTDLGFDRVIRTEHIKWIEENNVKLPLDKDSLIFFKLVWDK